MGNVTYCWLFFLTIRPYMSFLGIPSEFVSILILSLQMVQVYIIAERNKYRLSHTFSLIILIVLCIYNKDTLATLNILLAIIIMRKESLKRIILVGFISVLFTFFLVEFFKAIGIMNDSLSIMPKGIAHTMGFSNTNITSAHYYTIIIMTSIFIINFCSYKILSFLLIFPCILIYNLTLGRTYYYGEIIFFALIVLYSIEYVYKFTKIILVILPILLYIVLFFLIKNYKNYPLLDIMFTTRFSKNSSYLDNCNILNYFIGYRRPSGALDNAFLAQFFEGGILSVYIFISEYLKGIKNDRIELINNLPFIISYLVVGISENSFSSFSILTVIFYKILQGDNKNDISIISLNNA